ncbi:MAG: 50S ribosomal protein L29 [Candidatus Bathyarchaeia archaeon]
MPIIRVKEIRDMTPEERAKKLNEFRTELLRLKTMVKAGGAVENPARIRELRKAIARILTIENEQKLEAKKTQKASGKGGGSGG